MTGMQTAIRCWRCGTDLSALPTPFGRHAACPDCRAALHVCRQCRHYDPSVSQACREPVADSVQDKTRANFCEWFQAGPGPAPGQQPSTAPRRQALDALFAAPDAASDPATPTSEDPRKALERLFKP